MLRINTILFFLGALSSVGSTLSFTAFNDTNCRQYDLDNSIWDGRIEPEKGCSAVTEKRPTTAFTITDRGSVTSCKVILMHTNDSSNNNIFGASRHNSCNLGRVGEKVTIGHMNRTCYQYSDWNVYMLSGCDDWVEKQWREDLAFATKRVNTMTIVGPIVGSVAAVVLILGAVCWRRQKKAERMQKHGKVEELELTRRIAP